ncbi:hypothetical protein [Chryseobacterium indoltheticum]|uniref:hypothetical protein n=1 Tax=Chryseobacterium indoltheticum TaxID=254 RepID=UPI003F4911A9
MEWDYRWQDYFWLAAAHEYYVILISVALIGMGSSIFHPEASRVAQLASGGQKGLAQSIFQVGGNSGSAIGPLLVALIILPLGQVLCRIVCYRSFHRNHCFMEDWKLVCRKIIIKNLLNIQVILLKYSFPVKRLYFQSLFYWLWYFQNTFIWHQ